MRDKRVKMIQSPARKWSLIAPKGHVMADGLAFQDVVEAEKWCKAYISSFHDWSYEIVPLKERK